MSTTWDLHDSYIAMELSSLPAKQSILDSCGKANVPSKDREQRVPGSTTEKGKVSFISVFFFLMGCVTNVCVIFAQDASLLCIILTLLYVLPQQALSQFLKSDVFTRHCK